MRRLVVLVLAGALIVPGAAVAQSRQQLEARCLANASSADEADVCLDIVRRLLSPAEQTASASLNPVLWGANACELVPDIEAVAGRELSALAPENAALDMGSGCYWSFEDPLDMIALDVSDPAAFTDLIEYERLAREQQIRLVDDLSGSDVVPEGVEIAPAWWWYRDSATGWTGRLIVGDPSAAVSVGVSLPGETRAQAIAEAIGREVLGR